MRKIFINILVFLLTFMFTACGVYTQGGTDGKTDDGGTNVNPSGKVEYFTVSLTLDGEKLPNADITAEDLSKMTAQWRDSFSFYEAKFDEKGVARIPQVDGNYNVLIKGLPDKYTYNPNVYLATNTEPYVTVEVYEIIKTRGAGKDKYNCIEISKGGIYRTTITEKQPIVYYQFEPTQSGAYGIESIVSTTENLVNPKASIYVGTIGWKPNSPSYVLDTGGKESTYTKNFKYDVELPEDGVGRVYTFAISARERNNEYPVTIEFALVKEGEFTLDRGSAPMIIPKEIPQDIDSAEYAEWMRIHNTETRGKTIVYPETVLDGGLRLFEGKRFIYNQTDGFYHVDSVDGPILYANISTACRFVDVSFTHIEDPGNSALRVSNGTENYKLFIQGYRDLAKDGYYCVYFPDNGAYCWCHCEENQVGVVGFDCASQALSCGEGCETCHRDCRPCPEAQRNVLGYGDVANADGMCPVTQELKDFLQKFSVSQRYYADGNGWVESNPNVKIDAAHEDQWLFACAYYQ